MLINFKDPETRYLIDYANLKGGLIKYQNNFLNEKQLNNFLKKKYLGVPLLLPYGIKFFDYSKAKYFEVNKLDIKKKIFSVKKKNYIGLKIFFKYGNIFCSNIKLKKKYKKKLNYILKFNQKSQNFIKKNKLKIGAFQTRNIPHLGHEKIFERYLTIVDKIFVNPLLGIRKHGDSSNIVLKKAYEVINKQYKNRIIYVPVICNMHYCGPREAMHHLNIREMLKFNYFAIGRDHAGAENAYKNEDAINLVRKNINKFKIKIFYHKGAFYCTGCKKIIIKDDCRHKNKLKEISGSKLRENVKNNITYKFLRKEIQNKLSKI